MSFKFMHRIFYSTMKKNIFDFYNHTLFTKTKTENAFVNEKNRQIPK